MLLYNILDSIKGIQTGIIRGLGMQLEGSMLSFFAYYMVAIPTGYFLGFKVGHGLRGLVWAFILGELIQIVGLQQVITSTDWQEVAERIEEENE